MQIAIFVYDHMTALDAVGPYEVLSRLPGAETVFVGERRGQVRCDTRHLALVADAELTEVSLPDIVVVPGWSGAQQSELLRPGAVHEWLRQVDRHTRWTTSVCTGSLILAACGLFDGRRATTHWLARAELARLGAVPSDDRVVFDGKYVSAAGVSAGIDMALNLTARVAGAATAQAIQLGLEYDPQPPFDAGSAAKAPADIVTAMTAIRGFILYGSSTWQGAPRIGGRGLVWTRTGSG
jgi:transcriptional regulator GlxA family with amidase domain